MIHYFTIGFCVEEQAEVQVTASGDDSYLRRAELIERDKAPLAVEAGGVLCGDADARFAGLLDLLLDTVARLRNQERAKGARRRLD
jgi:hypothetical protein